MHRLQVLRCRVTEFNLCVLLGVLLYMLVCPKRLSDRAEPQDVFPPRGHLHVLYALWTSIQPGWFV